ncbi:MAG: hypothetical protein WD712_01900 [Candidatus Spechtbacterales bacterium]
MENVEFRIAPEIEPFIDVESGNLDLIRAGEENTIILSVAMPTDAPLRTFDGVIQINATEKLSAIEKFMGRVLTKKIDKQKHLAKPLPVEVEVISAQPTLGLFEEFLIEQFGTLTPEVDFEGDVYESIATPEDIISGFSQGTEGAFVLGIGSIKFLGPFGANEEAVLGSHDLLTELADQGVIVDDLMDALKDHDMYIEGTKDVSELLITPGLNAVIFFPRKGAQFFTTTPYDENGDGITDHYVVILDNDTHVLHRAHHVNAFINRNFFVGNILNNSSRTLVHELLHAVIFRTNCFVGTRDDEEVFVEDMLSVLDAKLSTNTTFYNALLSQTLSDFPQGEDCLDRLGLEPVSQQWSTPETVSTITGSFPDIDTDQNNIPHVVWYNSTPSSTNIFYSKQNTDRSWISPQDISGVLHAAGNPPELTIDITQSDSGSIHVAWSAVVEENNQEIFYSRYNGSSWSTPLNVSNTSVNSTWPSITLDSAGNPHIVWEEFYVSVTPTEIYYTQFNGSSWSTPQNISNSSSLSLSPIIATDNQNNLHAIWYEQPNLLRAEGLYYTKNISGNWVSPVKIFDTHGSGIVHPDAPSIVIDKNDNIHLAWTDNISGNGEIYYSKYANSSWQDSQNISNSAGTSWASTISVDSNDNPHIAWSDGVIGTINYNIKYTNYNGTQWQDIQIISNVPGRSFQPEMAIGTDDVVHLVWFDIQSGTYIFYSSREP